MNINNKLNFKKSINNINMIWKDIEKNDIEKLNDYWVSDNSLSYQVELDELKKYFNNLIKKLENIDAKIEKAEIMKNNNFR